MSGEIIIPEGMELIKYLSDGYKICNECGAVMDSNEDTDDAWVILTCPSCGWTIDEDDYEYDDGDYEDDEESIMLQSFVGDVPPRGCRDCGGPYPHCKTSCRLFDD